MLCYKNILPDIVSPFLLICMLQIEIIRMTKIFKTITCLIFVFISSITLAQTVLDQKIDASAKGKSLQNLLESIEGKQPVRFYFLADWVKNITIEKDYQDQPLRLVLDDLFLGSDLNYVEFNNYTIVLVKDPKQAIQRNLLLSDAQRERKKIENLQFGDPKSVSPAQKITISGTVRGNKNGEFLLGASVYITNLSKGVTTNAEGKFQLQVSSGEHIINFSYVNYEEKVINLKGYQDGEINIELEEIPTVLEEVIVQDKASREAVSSSIGQIQISIKDIKRAPSFLGEVDLIKQIQVLPGVTTAGEAASGFNVRGGSVDQNLILYDGVPIFNSSHVFGFFSAFNSEAIRDATFYRGGIPAEYGGRVSSVLDIRSKEGDYEKWKGGGGIGLITSNLHIGGPIVKDKTSVTASVRTTYSDWLINSIRTNYIDLRNSSVTFYDATFKLTHKFSNNTKISFSGYTSQDQFRLQGDSSYRWRNILGSIQLDHIFSPKFTASLQVGYGSYGYEVVNKNPANGFNLSYQITYPSFKTNFHYQLGKHKLSFGLQSTLYGFDPGSLKPISSESIAKPIQIEKQQSLESAIYLGDNISITEKINVEAGLRFSLFTSMGPGTINIYKPGLPIETNNFVNTVTYKSGETIKSYNGLEPRLSFRYTLSPTSSVKAGYNRIYQYLHLVTNTTAITPVDIWQPSGTYFKPQVADQYSIGYFRTTKKKTYDMFVEFYYKKVDNILDFKDGAKLLLNQQIETDLLQGVGTAYGVETQIVKSLGRLTGSIGYTYSRSLRTIQGPTATESINGGKQYPSNFDQPHIANISWKYNISRRYFFTGSFTYRTGRPITTPLSGFVIDNIGVSNFSERNAYRIPDYHRLDLALVLEGSHKRKKIFDGTWTFSIFNVYGRKNPYTIFFREAVNGTLVPYQLSIIGTALPSITYSVKF